MRTDADAVEEIRMKKERKVFSPPLRSLVVGKYAQDRGTFQPHQKNRFVNLRLPLGYFLKPGIGGGKKKG